MAHNPAVFFIFIYAHLSHILFQGPVLLTQSHMNTILRLSGRSGCGYTKRSASEGSRMILDADGEDLPNDWYLRLAGEAQKMKEWVINLTDSIPISHVFT